MLIKRNVCSICDGFTKDDFENINKGNPSSIKVISLQECNISFDYIRSNQVFEYLSNQKILLEQLKNKLHEKLDFQSEFNAIFLMEHINCFNPKNLKLIVNKVKLKKYKFPLKSEYSSSTNWALENILSNLYKPIINKYLKDKNNMCFKKI